MNAYLPFAAIVSAVIVLLLDLVSPTGFAVGCGYVVALLFAVRIQHKHIFPAAPLILSLLIAVAYFLKSPLVPGPIAVANRIFMLMVLWAAAVLARSTRESRASLVRSEEEHKILLDHVPDLITRLDRSFRPVFFNHAAELLAGRSRGQLPGMTDGPPGVPEEWREHARTVFDTGQEARFDIPFGGPGGTVWYSCRIVPEFDDAGRVASILCIGRDISVLRRTQEEMHRHKENFRTIVEDSPHVIARFDRELRITYVSPSVFLFSGKEPAAYLGKTPREAASLFDPVPVMEQLRAALEGNGTVTSDYSATMNGRPRHFSMSCLPERGENGETVSLLCAIRDVTALKASEARTSHVIENIRDGFFALNRDWRFIFINKRAAENMGCEPGQLVGESIWEKFPHLAGTEEERHYRKAMEETIPVTFVTRGKRDGRFYDVRIYPSPEGVTVLLTDITVLRRTEEALKVRQATIEAFFDAAPSIFILWDDQLRFLNVDKNTPKYYGLGREEVIGLSIRELAPLYAKEAEGTFRRVLRDGEVITNVEMVTPVPASNDISHWLMSYFPVPLENGKRGIGLVGVEITDRKRAEDALLRAYTGIERTVAERTAELKRANQQFEKEVRLRETMQRRTEASNRLLQLIAASTQRHEYMESVVGLLQSWSGCACAGIRLIDDEGRAPYAARRGFSDEFCRKEDMLVLDRDECACIRVISGRFKPQDLPQLTRGGSCAMNDTSACIAALSDEEKKDFRGACVASGYRSVAVIPLTYKEKTLGVIHLADARRDRVRVATVEFIESLTPLIGEGITKTGLFEKLHQNNEFLERMFSSTNFLMAYLDTELRFIRVNQSYADAGGHPADFYTGKNHFELYPHEENRRIFQGVVRTGEPFIAYARPFDYPEYPERGTTYWDWNLQPVKDSEGKVEGLLFALVDVTLRRRTEEELQKTQRELLDARRLSDIGVLSATMAHEMRNPLAAINAAAYNVKRKSADPALVKHLAVIEKKVFEGNRIINNLLTFARIKMPHYEQVKLREVLEECCRNVFSKYAGEKIALKKEFACPDDRIIADPTQLALLFSNILDNAFHALPDKSGAVGVKALPAGTDFEIVISDTGVGIEAGDLDKIFDPFFTRKSKGTGLGLAICRQIVELHQGTIDVSSTVGKGTVFKIFLHKDPQSFHPPLGPAAHPRAPSFRQDLFDVG